MVGFLGCERTDQQTPPLPLQFTGKSEDKQLPTDNLTYFLVGGGIGLISAVVGAFVDYFVGRRRRNDEEDHPPGCMLVITGILGVIGLAAMAVSLLFGGMVRIAVVIGLGVLSGFFVGFAVLFVGALVSSGRGSE
ncbi:MAG: hypothetical protein IPM39_15830 [Chloroflexi bacterium]|nr:hypothetical protein [Chloroflexota bacterium]